MAYRVLINGFFVPCRSTVNSTPMHLILNSPNKNYAHVAVRSRYPKLFPDQTDHVTKKYSYVVAVNTKLLSAWNYSERVDCEFCLSLSLSLSGKKDGARISGQMRIVYTFFAIINVYIYCPNKKCWSGTKSPVSDYSKRSFELLQKTI